MRNQPVGATSCCYADRTDIEPGHTSTFDSFAMKSTLSLTPSSYRLSFENLIVSNLIGTKR